MRRCGALRRPAMHPLDAPSFARGWNSAEGCRGVHFTSFPSLTHRKLLCSCVEFFLAQFGRGRRAPRVRQAVADLSSTQSDSKRQARDLEMQSLGVNPPLSFNSGHSDGGHSRHSRSPSNALSFTSTIPDTDEGLLSHRGNDTRSVDGAGKKGEGKTGGDEDGEEEEPKKFLGIFKRKKKVAEVAKVRPDPSPQEMAPFAVDLTPSNLYHLIDPKNYEHLAALGGTPGLLSGLHTDAKLGLSDEGGVASLEERLRVYGANKTPARKGKNLLQLMWMAYQDKVLVSPRHLSRALFPAAAKSKASSVSTTRSSNWLRN